MGKRKKPTQGGLFSLLSYVLGGRLAPTIPVASFETVNLTAESVNNNLKYAVGSAQIMKSREAL